MRHSILLTSVFVLTAGLACAAPGLNQGTASPAFKSSGVVELGGNYHHVSNNFGDWSGQYIKGEYQSDASNRWSAEFDNQKEFRDNGVYGSIGNTHVFNEDWFSAVTLGTGGEKAVFYPRFRADAFINRKWLEQRQLITTLGVGLYKAIDGHRDQSLFLGATYYFQSPWIIQGGIRFNNSNPGDVNSHSQFVAVTQGVNKSYFVTLRYGFGEEAYQLIGPDTALSEFKSHNVSLELRKWMSEDIGFTVRGERYHNPNYDRTGVSIGIFKEF